VNELWDRDRVVGLRGTDQRGANVDVAARLVVGADGFHSRVAKAVAPSEYDVHPPLVAACYSYFHNFTLPDGVQFEFHGGVHRAIFAWPTNNDEVILGVNWKAEELEAKRKNQRRNSSLC
jgi:2-polyprenyl-6-methoxyphenol hydroxylase-like FAD-dependent oxidoreductase